MKIGLIDVDGHNYPNLALMKISAYHKANGDSVEWWWGFGQYDRVIARLFSDHANDLRTMKGDKHGKTNIQEPGIHRQAGICGF